jgi:formylmethanofuran dehydrogenase subunit B
MTDAWIKGAPSPFQGAVEHAAALLSRSRLPLIAGLGTDVAGARAALALAERVGGAVDHMHSTAVLRNLDAMREGGMLVTTPNEARLRCDVLLLVGPRLTEAWSDLPERLFTNPQRRIVWLCPGAPAKEPHIEVIGDDPAHLPALLAVLRARVAGRPVADKAQAIKKIETLATALKQARFGVAVWSATELDPLTIDMLCGLVKDLNDKTRFTSLPLMPGDNAAAVQQVSGWKTGFPLRTGFGRGFPEHDPWRFDAVRLVDSGEADCALWIAATSAAAPAWRRKVPLIVLTATPDELPFPSEVRFVVGRPGVDHDAVEHLAATGTLAPLRAQKPANTPTVADVVTQIAAALPAARPC